jgi:hypothetical protein
MERPLILLSRQVILNDAHQKMTDRYGNKVDFKSYKGDWAGLLQRIQEIDNDARGLCPESLAMMFGPNFMNKGVQELGNGVEKDANAATSDPDSLAEKMRDVLVFALRPLRY